MTWGPSARFGMEGQAAISNAGLSSASSGQTMAEIFGTNPTAYGRAVTDSSAMQVGTVYACLEKLGGVVLQLPLHHYRLDSEGERSRVFPNSPLWWLVNESPAPAWTAASWKEWIVRCVKLRGDQHTHIVRNSLGTVVALKPLHPDCVVPKTVAGRLRYDCWDPETGAAFGVDQDDMLHFTGFGFDGERSVSAIKWAARNAISNSLASADFMGKALADGGMPKIAIETPGVLSPDAARVMRESFVETYLTPSNGRRLPLVLTQGGKASPLNISPVDLEIMAARRMDKGEICEALGVPPIIIGDSEKTSSWGTGVEQITLGWVRFSVQPMLARWEEELNRKLFRRSGQFLEFSLAALLRGDSKAQAEAYRAALGGPGTGDGWMALNEVRKQLNLPPVSDPTANVPYRAERAQPTETNTAPPAP